MSSFSSGINPLLWRPQAGISQFSVPPYVFDLSVLAPVLNDGKVHDLCVQMIGNNAEGGWYPDPVLRVRPDRSVPSSSVLGGSVIRQSAYAAVPRLTLPDGVSQPVYRYQGRSTLSVTSVMHYPNGERSVTLHLEAESTIENQNYIGDVYALTSANITALSKFRRVLSENQTVPMFQESRSLSYPVWYNTSSFQNNNSFYIWAAVNYSRNHTLAVNGCEGTNEVLSHRGECRNDGWHVNHTIHAQAWLNETTLPNGTRYSPIQASLNDEVLRIAISVPNHGSPPHITTKEHTPLISPGSVCYEASAQSKNGTTVKHAQKVHPGMDAARYCHTFDACAPVFPPPRETQRQEDGEKEGGGNRGGIALLYPFRHPNIAGGRKA
jgi:hypothetical protein